MIGAATLQPAMDLIAHQDCLTVVLLAAGVRFQRVTGGEHLTWLAIGGYVATALLVVGVFLAHRRRERHTEMARLNSADLPSETAQD
jgi:hypothetical protein